MKKQGRFEWLDLVWIAPLVMYFVSASMLFGKSFWIMTFFGFLLGFLVCMCLIINARLNSYDSCLNHSSKNRGFGDWLKRDIFIAMLISTWLWIPAVVAYALLWVCALCGSRKAQNLVFHT